MDEREMTAAVIGFFAGAMFMVMMRYIALKVRK